MAIFPTYKAPVNKNNNTNKNQQSITVPSVSACKPIYDNQAQIDSLNSILANFNMLKAANSFVQCDQKFIDQVTTALKNAIANGRVIGNTCETSGSNQNSINRNSGTGTLAETRQQCLDRADVNLWFNLSNAETDAERKAIHDQYSKDIAACPSSINVSSNTSSISDTISLTMPPPPIRANISSTNGVNPVNPPSEKLADCIAKANATLNSDLDAILGLWNRGEINDSQKTYLVNRAQNAHDSACGGAAKGAISVSASKSYDALSIANPAKPNQPGKPNAACRDAAVKLYNSTLDVISSLQQNGNINFVQAYILRNGALSQCNSSCVGLNCGSISAPNINNSNTIAG